MHCLYLQVAPVLKMNTPLEMHASDIYTRTMAEKFGEVIYEAGQYKVEEITKGKTYFAKRYHPEKHAKWCRVLYKVEVVDEGTELICECGNFEHTCLLCCHAVKVLRFPWHRPYTSKAYAEAVDEGRKGFAASPPVASSEG